jgi:hypothetical protein
MVKIIENPKKTVLQQYKELKDQIAQKTNEYSNRLAQCEKNDFEKEKRFMLEQAKGKLSVCNVTNFSFRNYKQDAKQMSIFKTMCENSSVMLKESNEKLEKYKAELTRLTGIKDASKFINLKQSPIQAYQCESEKSKYDKSWYAWLTRSQYSNPDLISDEQTVNIIMRKPIKFEFNNPGWVRRSTEQGWKSFFMSNKTKQQIKYLEQKYSTELYMNQLYRKKSLGSVVLHQNKDIIITDPNYNLRNPEAVMKSILEGIRSDEEERIKKYRAKMEKKLNKYSQSTYFKICEQYQKCSDLVKLDKLLEKKNQIVTTTEQRIQDLYGILREKQSLVRELKNKAHMWLQQAKEKQYAIIQAARAKGERIKDTAVVWRNRKRHQQYLADTNGGTQEAGGYDRDDYYEEENYGDF